jgi:hypothetical protein
MLIFEAYENLKKIQMWLKSDKNLREEMYKIFCRLMTMQREPIVAFLWQHSTVLYG